MAEKKQTGKERASADTNFTSLNRYSMPVTRSRTGLYSDMNLDGTNTTRFLFGDEDAAGETKGLVAGSTEDSFPTLVRREDFGLVSLFAVSPLGCFVLLCEASVVGDSMHEMEVASPAFKNACSPCVALPHIVVSGGP